METCFEDKHHVYLPLSCFNIFIIVTSQPCFNINFIETGYKATHSVNAKITNIDIFINIFYFYNVSAKS